MENTLELIYTLLIGLFIMVGALLVFISKNNENFIHFSMNLALGVIVSLIVLELLPETIEVLGEKYSNFTVYLTLIITIMIGIVFLKIIDYFIPHHHESDGHKHHSNLYHVGIISTIALVLHNIIEGMALFNALKSSFSMGVMLSIGIGLHNIPLGMVMTSTLYNSTKNKRKTLIYVGMVSLSTFIGGLIMFFGSDLLSNELVLGISLGITTGMLIYISLFELLPHLKHGNLKKNIIGVIVGILLIILSMFFGHHHH